MAIRSILWRSNTNWDIKMKCSFCFRQWAGAVREISSQSHGDEVLGIDFGATNSRVAIMEGLIPTIVYCETGRAMPTYVAHISETNILVGETAKDHSIVYPESVLFKIRSILGRRFNDLRTQKLKGVVPYKIVEGSNGEALIDVGVKRISPTDVCACIIRKMKETAETHLKKSVSKAVITVPVHFNDVQRQEMKVAGKSAGLDVLGIIDESIAAATSSLKRISNGVVAVVDMGGETFDVSILEISNGAMQVKGRNDDPFLGGVDFDNALVEYFVKEISRTYSIDVSGDRIAMMRLQEAAENAKVELSSAFFADTCIQYIDVIANVPIHFNISLTRSTFEKMVCTLIERARIQCENCLENAQVSPTEIDDVLLVGGMARAPWLRQMVVKILGKSLNVEVDPLEAVAVGAAIQAGFINEDEKEQEPNILPLSLGIDTLGGVFARIINRNTRIPTKASQTFSVESDNQMTIICLRILQGERKMSIYNKIVGELKLIGNDHAPQRIPHILVTFDIDANGKLTVSAKDMDSGMEKAIIVNMVTEIKDAKNMVKEAMLNGIRDKEKSDLVYFRSLAELYISLFERFLHVKNAIPADHRLRMEAALRDLRHAMDSNNPIALKWKIYDAARQTFLSKKKYSSIAEVYTDENSFHPSSDDEYY